MATATEEADKVTAVTENGEMFNVDDLLQQSQQTGRRAIAAYNSLREQEKAVKAAQRNRLAFCNDQGVDLDRVVDKFVGSHEVGDPAASRELKFVLTYAKSQGAGGFTTMELMDAAKKEGFKVGTKDERQPLLRAILDANTGKMIQEATFKRADNTVYVKT